MGRARPPDGSRSSSTGRAARRREQRRAETWSRSTSPRCAASSARRRSPSRPSSTRSRRRCSPRTSTRRTRCRTPASRSTARPATSSSGRRSSAPTASSIEEYDDTPTDFGRVAAMTARQVILQRLRDAEHDQTFGEYSGREGDIVTGVIQADAQAAQRGLVLVDIGKVEAILPQSEQVPGEEYTHGTRIKCYVVGVARGHARAAGDASAAPTPTWSQAVRARGARDRRRQRRDRRRRPRGRAPHQDRRAHHRSPGSTPRAPASARWASGCATSSPSCTARRSTSSTGPTTRRRYVGNALSPAHVIERRGRRPGHASRCGSSCRTSSCRSPSAGRARTPGWRPG